MKQSKEKEKKGEGNGLLWGWWVEERKSVKRQSKENRNGKWGTNRAPRKGAVGTCLQYGVEGDNVGCAGQAGSVGGKGHAYPVRKDKWGSWHRGRMAILVPDMGRWLLRSYAVEVDEKVKGCLGACNEFELLI